MEASVLGDVDRDAAPETEILAEVEDERVGVDDVSRSECDDRIARTLEHPALARIAGEARQLAGLPGLAAVDARREPVRGVAAVSDPAFLVDGDDVLGVGGVDGDRRLDLRVGLHVVLDRVGNRGRQAAELVRARFDVADELGPGRRGGACCARPCRSDE